MITGFSKAQETKSKEDLGRELHYHFEKGDTLKVIEVLEKFNSDNPENIEFQAALTVLKMQAGLISKEESMKLLKEFYQKDSTNKWVRQFNYQRIVEESPPEEGLLAIEKMIADDPNDFWNYLEKGRKLIELKKYNEAIIAFDKAIQLEPMNKYAYADRAHAKYLMGDKEGACNDWKNPGGGAMTYYEKYCK